MFEYDENTFEDGLTKTPNVTSLGMMLPRSEWSLKRTLVRAYLSTMFLFRRRFYAPLTQTCTAGVCARSCKSRRASRPRKPDVTLSRHGRRARRVAFLSPRAMFGDYCSPLDYLYARFKLYQNDEKFIPHFRRTELFPSGGGIPEGKEGEQYSNVRDAHSILRLSTPRPPSGCCMSSHITPKQTGTNLYPTEYTFGGDPELPQRSSGGFAAVS